MLQQYAQNPEQNWKAKDCAIYLVVALTVKGKTAAQGATTTNELVGIPDFFNQHIMPELQSANLDERPVLKADALKFLTTFRSQIPKAQCVMVSHVHCSFSNSLAVALISKQLQPDRPQNLLFLIIGCYLQIFQLLVTLLSSESNVVHTYAAVAVERLLAQKV